MSIDIGSYEFIRDLVKERSAIVLDDRKRYQVEARLAPLCKKLRLGSTRELVSRLRNQPQKLVAHVINAIAGTETSFFRDAHSFDATRDTILPELIERRQAERELNIWCAACSSGQEPVTIALITREHFPELADWNIRIRATDINHETPEQGRSGEYSLLEVSRGLPTEMLQKYFTEKGTHWKVADEIHGMIEYGHLNLAEPLPAMRKQDIVFMRNVLSFFDEDTKALVLENTSRLIEPDGYLVLGATESTPHLSERFAARALESTTCFRPAA